MPKNPKGRAEGDVVLIYYQEKPSIYARIESIEPDIKEDWYRVFLLFLTIPPQMVTWVLREEYINGDPFTMGGEPVRLADIDYQAAVGSGSGGGDGPVPDRNKTDGSAKVVPFKKRP